MTTASPPNKAELQKILGQVILFVGVEAEHWTVNTFAGAAKFARTLGVDTLCAKRCDGSIKWYGTPEQLKAERQACLDAGVGYLPFAYCYGPKFGDHQIKEECACLIEMAEANGNAGVLADLESEWNGQVAAAEYFESIMRPVPIVLGITTFGDAAQTDWLGVAQALAPCANYWVPQLYDNWLAAQLLPPEETIVIPGVDLSSEFGANNVAAIVRGAAQKHESCMFWEYHFAQAGQALMRELAAALHGESSAIMLVATADELVTPAPGFAHAYVTGPADADLVAVAKNLGLSNWYEQLYKPNADAVETAVKAAGYPAGSSSGLLIVPGIQLNYNLG